MLQENVEEMRAIMNVKLDWDRRYYLLHLSSFFAVPLINYENQTSWNCATLISGIEMGMN